ncbi:hypothetical protein ACNE9Y_30055 [Pseudomonas sp. NY11226]|uniref:hypothetical protein n=1 Tax=Pseudomonas sp. NY11226 TaxID=3400362 RepID=UPI003A8356BE
MKISIVEGKLDFSSNTSQIENFKAFLNIVKLVESASILQKHVDSSEIGFIPKVLAYMQKIGRFSKPEDKDKAEALMKAHLFPISTHLPIYTAIRDYNRQDLALAISYIFADDLPGDLWDVIDLTEQGALIVAMGLLEGFNPSAIPKDLEAKASGKTGEFVRFSNSPMAFYNAVETKRPFQYQHLLGKDYYQSKRYARLQELLASTAKVDETISTITPALPAFNPPEELLKPLKPVEQEEEIVLHIEEVEVDNDSFLDDAMHEELGFVEVDENGNELVDIDDGDVSDSIANDFGWMKDVEVRKS